MASKCASIEVGPPCFPAAEEGEEPSSFTSDCWPSSTLPLFLRLLAGLANKPVVVAAAVVVVAVVVLEAGPNSGLPLPVFVALMWFAAMPGKAAAAAAAKAAALKNPPTPTGNPLNMDGGTTAGAAAAAAAAAEGLLAVPVEVVLVAPSPAGDDEAGFQADDCKADDNIGFVWCCWATAAVASSSFTWLIAMALLICPSLERACVRVCACVLSPPCSTCVAGW